MTKYGCHRLEEPTENELSTQRENLFSGQVQPRFIEETARILELIYQRYFDVRKLPIQRLPDNFKSLGPSKVRIYYSLSKLPFIFAPITCHALPSWLISTALESTTTQSRLHITTPRYQTFTTPRVKLPLDLVDQTRLGPIKVHPVDFNNKN